MYRSLGWSRADCAKFLHVTERCLHNWESGRHAMPFAAFKLLRLHLGYELPGPAWDGWHIAAGKLYTPEGHGLSPQDARWWSLLARRAEIGSLALRELHALKAHMEREAAACAVTGCIMGKPAPDTDLADRLNESATQTRCLRPVSRERISTAATIRQCDYRRVLDMAEDLLLIAHAQAKMGNHPDAEIASRWLLNVAETCKARLVDSGLYQALARDTGRSLRRRNQ